MVSMTKTELEYINLFYQKDGNMEIISVNKQEQLCVVSIPIIDGQEDIFDMHKTVVFPISYDYDGENVYVYNIPEMLSTSEDITEIIIAIKDTYQSI